MALALMWRKDLRLHRLPLTLDLVLTWQFFDILGSTVRVNVNAELKELIVMSNNKYTASNTGH